MRHFDNTEVMIKATVDGLPDEGSGAHSREWFERAISTPKESCHFVRDGARLHMLRWNWTDGADRPAVLLLHGFIAHSHWWDAIAPVLARDYRVAALDISGMGDSDARPHYAPDWAARDILAAIDFLDIAPATVVAHSFGGSRALQASVLQPGVIKHAVVLDSYYNFVGESPPGSGGMGPRKIYPSMAEALKRYRLMPASPDIPPEVFQYAARHSIKPFEGGWTWKFDPGLAVREEADGASILARVDAIVDYVHAGKSALVSAERAQKIVDALPRTRFRQPVTFPGVHHHLLLERPLALARLIRSLLRRDLEPELS